MKPSDQIVLTSRRPIAVGIWTLEVVLMVFLTMETSFGVSTGLMLVISAMSSTATVFASETLPGARKSQIGRDWMSLALSIIIGLMWALLLSRVNSLSIVTMYLMIGWFPAGFVWLITKPAAVSNEFPIIATVSGGQMDPLPVIDKPTTDPDLDFESTEEQHLRFESMAPNITQWLTRSLSVDGEIIEGGVRIEFDEGQRDATVHVSFCPPFHRVPEVTTEDLDAAGLEIRVAAIFPFGSRLSVRRAQGPKNREKGLQKEACRIGFVAIVAAAKRAA